MLIKRAAFRLFATSSFLFLSIFLLSFSCEDHPEPPRIFPKINTLDITRVDNAPTFEYKVQFTELGNQQIAEYGVVTYAGSANENFTPVIPVVDDLKNRKYDFSGPGYMPPSLDIKSVIRQYTGPTGQIRLFYRAYARLANNFVVYGQVKFVDFNVADAPEEIAPEIQTIEGAKSADYKDLVFRLRFTKQGSIPVVEYGVAYVLTTVDAVNVVPGINDLRANFTAGHQPYTDVDGPGEQKTVPHNLGTGDWRVFYRAYAILDNGATVFGEVKSFTLSTF